MKLFISFLKLFSLVNKIFINFQKCLSKVLSIFLLNKFKFVYLQNNLIAKYSLGLNLNLLINQFSFYLELYITNHSKFSISISHFLYNSLNIVLMLLALNIFGFLNILNFKDNSFNLLI